MNTQRAFLLILSLAFLTAAYIFYYGAQESPARPNAETTVGENTNQAPSNETENTGSMPVLHLPSKAEYQEDALKNPHNTPEVILKFAETTAQAMDQGLSNPEQGKELMQQFENCALRTDDELVVSIRALCVINAKRLVKKFNQLEKESQWIETDLSPALKDLVQVMEQQHSSGQ